MRNVILGTFLALAVAACGGGTVDADPFATFEACFDEHHNVESLTVQHTITVCCLDHPIGSAAAGVVCGTTEAACESYVDANLLATDATAPDITASCTDYINQRTP